MSKRLDPEVAKKVMLDAGLQPLEPYTKSSTVWKSRCLKCNRIVYPRHSDIKKGHSGCAYCASRRVDAKDAVEVMKKAKLQPLEPYANSSTKWKCRCLKCKKIVCPKYNAIRSGQGGCGYCAKKFPDLKNIMIVMKKAHLEPLEPYKNSDSKWKCRCLKCKNIVYPRYGSIRDGQGGCLTCGNKKQADSRRLDQKTAINIMLKANLKPLEPYRGSGIKWKCTCLICKKIVYPLLDTIVGGHTGCKYCAGKAVTPAHAKKLFIKAKLMPLEPYRNGRTKWKSKCMVCGEIVYPTYSNISMGHGGCLNCSDIGFKPKQPALLYLITHQQMNAIKVGITNTTTVISRLDQFKRHGWQIHKKYRFKEGIEASKIEAKIMNWLKKDLKLPSYLSKKDMPDTKGHMETFNADSISVVAIEKRIELLIKGLQE